MNLYALAQPAKFCVWPSIFNKQTAIKVFCGFLLYAFNLHYISGHLFSIKHTAIKVFCGFILYAFNLQYIIPQTVILFQWLWGTASFFWGGGYTTPRRLWYPSEKVVHKSNVRFRHGSRFYWLSSVKISKGVVS